MLAAQLTLHHSWMLVRGRGLREASSCRHMVSWKLQSAAVASEVLAFFVHERLSPCLAPQASGASRHTLCSLFWLFPPIVHEVMGLLPPIAAPLQAGM